jgi:hypothetical protein
MQKTDEVAAPRRDQPTHIGGDSPASSIGFVRLPEINNSFG